MLLPTILLAPHFGANLRFSTQNFPVSVRFFPNLVYAKPGSCFALSVLVIHPGACRVYSRRLEPCHPLHL